MASLSQDTRQILNKLLAEHYKVESESSRDAIVDAVNETLSVAPVLESNEPPDPLLQLIIRKGDRSASLKMANIIFNWKRVALKLAGLSLRGTTLEPLSMSLAICAVLATGSVIVFDEVDTQIIKCIYEEIDISEKPDTSAAFSRLSGCLGPEVSERLFMSRLVKLADAGSIRIDGDVLVVTERYWISANL